MTGFRYPLKFAGQPTTKFWEDYRVGVDPDFVSIFMDFLEVDDDQTNLLTVVKDTSATVGIAADTANGRLTMSSAATTDDDGSSIQGNEVFLPLSGRTIWFETKLFLSDADQMDMCVGLSVNFTTNPENLLTAANRIVFQVNDSEGNGSIHCKTEAGGTETSTDSGVDAADATDVILGFRVEGTGTVYFYINRLLVATHTTNIPVGELAFALMELSGNAVGTKYMSVDYILAACTR